MTPNDIATEINTIKARNQRVEADKAWETSWARKILVAILTYLVMVLTMALVLKSSRPFLDAIIPTLGFLLSGLSLGVAKNLWLRHFYQQN